MSESLLARDTRRNTILQDTVTNREKLASVNESHPKSSSDQPANVGNVGVALLEAR